MDKKLLITGIRGIPAHYGGFETFAEELSLYLVEHGWEVTVYCQENAELDGVSAALWESNWQGITLVHVPVKGDTALASIKFDWLCLLDVIKRDGLVLTLGYNTALFNVLLRVKGRSYLMNMDGLEWQRNKWRWYEKTWLYLNERFGCWFANHLIADHPEIARHLETRVSSNKITTVGYGGREVCDADAEFIQRFGLQPKGYAIVIARPEPENHILEIVQAFSERPRNCQLVILGNYSHDESYQAEVLKSASSEVKFIGAIYDAMTLDSLRFNAKVYIHGHKVGGTNPSLIEALGAAQPILAHDNVFNRYVAGKSAVYFKDAKDCDKQLSNLLGDESKLTQLSQAAHQQFLENYRWQIILQKYQTLLEKYV